MQKIGTAGPLIVIEVVVSGQRDALESTSMSAAESMATPQCPPRRASAVVGVAAHQRGHVEGHGQARSPGGQQHLVPLVGLPRVAEPGELADRPRLAAVAGGVDAPGERELPRPADPVEVRHHRVVRRSVDRVYLKPGERGEIRVAFGRLVEAALPAVPAGV
jgi:hypothetical protein